MNRDEEKEAIRKEYHVTLSHLPDDVKKSSRLGIERRLSSVSEFQKAAVVSVYASKENEVGTSGIFNSLWSIGDKVVLAPRIKGSMLEMCRVRSVGDFVQGPYGLKEPALEIEPYDSDIDVVIVPGLAFDTHGVRIGRGKGYYDRFLNITNAVKIGLAYDIQIALELPESTNDRRMDIIITEKRIIRSAQK